MENAKTYTFKLALGLKQSKLFADRTFCQTDYLPTYLRNLLMFFQAMPQKRLYWMHDTIWHQHTEHTHAPDPSRLTACGRVSNTTLRRQLRKIYEQYHSELHPKFPAHKQLPTVSLKNKR